MPTLDIVIVNWNAGHQIRRCLESIPANGDGLEVTRVVVVDNASTDGSLDELDTLPVPLTILRNAANRGFGAACNQGAERSQSDYLLFLNPDTMLEPDSLVCPVSFLEMEGNRDVGICGIQLVDDHGQIARTCARFPRPAYFYQKMLGLDTLFARQFQSHFMTEWDHSESRRVDQVMGAFFLVRRTLFTDLKGFDERFFVYFEEVDFSLRALQHGAATCYLAGPRAYHKGCGTSEQAKSARLFYSLRSRIRYAFKHFRWDAAALLTLCTLVIEPVARVVMAAARRSPNGVAETFRGYGRLWGALLKGLAASR